MLHDHWGFHGAVRQAVSAMSSIWLIELSRDPPVARPRTWGQGLLAGLLDAPEHKRGTHTHVEMRRVTLELALLIPSCATAAEGSQQPTTRTGAEELQAAQMAGSKAQSLVRVRQDAECHHGLRPPSW